MESLLSRLKEPSTYAGLAGLALLLGFQTEEWQNWINASAGIFAFVSIILGESKK
jgi:hypothetical protein